MKSDKEHLKIAGYSFAFKNIREINELSGTGSNQLLVTYSTKSYAHPGKDGIYHSVHVSGFAFNSKSALLKCFKRAQSEWNKWKATNTKNDQ